MAPPLWPILMEIEVSRYAGDVQCLILTMHSGGLFKRPSFHRGVEKIHKNVQRIKHGIPPEEMGGTKLDDPNRKSIKHFFDLFWEELKTGHKPEPKNKK